MCAPRAVYSIIRYRCVDDLVILHNRYTFRSKDFANFMEGADELVMMGVTIGSRIGIDIGLVLCSIMA